MIYLRWQLHVYRWHCLSVCLMATQCIGDTISLSVCLGMWICYIRSVSQNDEAGIAVKCHQVARAWVWFAARGQSEVLVMKVIWHGPHTMYYWTVRIGEVLVVKEIWQTTHNVLLDCTCVLFENMLIHCLSWCCAYHCPVRYFAMSDSLFFSAAQHTEFISLLCFNACSSRAERWNLDGWKCRRCTVQWVVEVNVNDSFVCACTLSRDDFSLFTFQFSLFGVIHF